MRSVYGFSANLVYYTSSSSGHRACGVFAAGGKAGLGGLAPWGLGAAGVRQRQGGHVTRDRRLSSEMEATQCWRSLNRDWKRKDTSKGTRMTLFRKLSPTWHTPPPADTERLMSLLPFRRGQPEPRRLRGSPSIGLDQLLLPLPRGRSLAPPASPAFRPRS